jgi:DNA-binding transcriptional MerR regulator
MSSKHTEGQELRRQAPSGAGPLLTVTQLAAELGVTARAIRFYEDKGLIEPQRLGTTRVYTRREAARMTLILRGKRLGFSLRQIKEFLDLYDVDSTQHAQMQSLIENVRARAAELDQQRQAITQTLAELADIEIQARAVLDGSDKKKPESRRAQGP